MEPMYIIAMIGGLIVLLLVIGAPVKPIRWIGAAAVRLMIGALFLFFLNIFGTSLDLHIPINLITTAVSGFLGIPGLCVLVAIKYLILS
ncbi:MAG TPA: pro-sigmaK processing inhibitor BofA family protein [Bacillales bacterium]|nr:pro-sigmaK processing inhibitor BofA family protein [Bacillales bacterium]